MRESPGSVVTLLCSGIQLYSAERRIADCILSDVKWASSVTSAELAHASRSSEATVTRLCHKLGFENYRRFQLALARDVMDQQEAEVQRTISQDKLRQTLSILRSAEIIQIEATGNALPVAIDASLKLSSLGKRCVTSMVAEKTRAFASTLTERDVLLLISSSGRSDRLLEIARVARSRGASVLLITCDRRSPLASQADHLLLASNRVQRIVDTDPAPSLLSSALLVEILYYLLLTGEDLTEA